MSAQDKYMTIAEAAKMLLLLIRSGVKTTPMFWSAPGMGKSSFVAQVAKELGLEMKTIIVSQIVVSDLHGLPVPMPETEFFKYLAPDIFPSEGKGILFLDEITQAVPTVQAVCQQLILEKRIGQYELPEGWVIVAAGNRKEDKAACYDMSTAVANRFLHFNIRCDYDSWKHSFGFSNIHPQIVAFLGFKPDLLHKMDIGTPAWPSPRSWEAASNLHTLGVPIGCAVGPSVELEFNTYLRVYESLPDVEAVLAGKGKSVSWPKDAAVTYATCTALLTRAMSASGDEMVNIMEWVIGKAPEEWQHKVIFDFIQLASAQKIKEKGAFYGMAVQNKALAAKIGEFASYTN